MRGSMQSFLSFFRRAIRYAWKNVLCRVKVWPAPASVLLAISHDRRITTNLSGMNERTVIMLFRMMSHFPADVCVSTGIRNSVWLFRNISGFRNMYWVPFIPVMNRWDLVVTDDPRLFPKHCRRRWLLEYDYRPDLVLTQGHVTVPYGVYPFYDEARNARVEQCRKLPRTMRIFFGGRIARDVYGDPTYVKLRFGKHTRTELLDALIRAGVVTFAESRERIFTATETGHNPEFIVGDSAKTKIPPDQWLEALGRADVFFAPPGIAMPMCHNIIEAMCVGTIPLTNYPEWFFPPLQHGVNCFAFSTPEELIQLVHEILAMSDEDLVAMRGACIDYFQEYLCPKAAMDALSSLPNAELRLHVLDESWTSL